MACELCKAIEEDYRVIYKDSKCFCIVNSQPLKPGHLMVLPRRHIVNLDELKGDELEAIHQLLNVLAERLTRIYGEDAIIFLNNGKHSSQPHIHYHILPSKGSLRDLFSSYEGMKKREDASKEELTRLAEKVRLSLESR